MKDNRESIGFDIAIPLSDSGRSLHDPADLRNWFLDTAKFCGGGSEMGKSLYGAWFDPKGEPEKNLVEDYNNWYRFGVAKGLVQKFRKKIQEAAKIFDQQCIYIQWGNKVEFLKPKSDGSFPQPGG